MTVVTTVVTMLLPVVAAVEVWLTYVVFCCYRHVRAMALQDRKYAMVNGEEQSV